ncbi:haloacid dehalogenase, type II [Sulfuriferula sp. AH1]|uniref:haloacid dehalogenase type II n=1 Tax=Sulfuriferula sp. AH1 TaxID=1985873 RepID=UPI000B3B2E46|nr:haloacid dehalogenase type II [Sulfuriferula sp. AH1]ARU31581.1 haloacid dehalogenase, type II [Sulfuriferula sp. AH1]
MSLNRREFINLAAAGIVTGLMVSSPLARAATSSKIKAIAFDAFPIFDPRPVFALAEQLFPGKGAELSIAWRTRQFEYQWLRALSGHYADFWQTTEDALVFSGELLKLDLTSDKRKQLMDAYLELKVWPDALPALRSLKSDGIRLAFLSNATSKILDAGIKNSGLDGLFEHVLSTDKIKSYKPAPRAYQMAIDAFNLKREEILFVPFAGWDAAGAKSFGYTTFWVNRLNLPAEKLGVVPDAVGQNLTDLLAFVKAAR